MTAIVAFALAVVALFIAVRRRFVVVTVCGQSMTPAYRDGDKILVVRARQCEQGDVVVFRHPDPRSDLSWLVKRVAATAGDRVPDAFAAVLGDGPVPEGRIVVTSDALGLDSRKLGYVRRSDLLGVELRSRRDNGRQLRHLRLNRYRKPFGVPASR